LLRELEAQRPALTLLIAPAGYGKSTIGSKFGAFLGHTLRVDCNPLTSVGAFARAILTAIASTPEGAAQNLSTQVVASSGVPNAVVDLLREVWQLDATDVIFFDNAEALADRPPVLDLFNELFHIPRTGGRMIVASRVGLPLRYARFASPSETRLITDQDLRFDTIEIAEAFRDRLAAPALRYVEESTQGWPVAVVLWSSRATNVDLASLQQDGKSFASADLSGYLSRELLDFTDRPLRDALAVCASIELLRSEDIVEVEKLIHSSGLEDRLRKTPLVSTNHNGEITMHPLLRAAVNARNLSRGKDLTAAIASAYAESGRAIRAAQLFQSIGDDDRAATVLGTDTTFLLTELSVELAQVIASFAPATLLAHPALWNAGTIGRAFLISQEQWRDEATRVWSTVDATTHPMVRAGCFNSLANVYINGGEFSRARALIVEYLSGTGEDDRSIAEMLAVMWRAAADTYEGRDIDLVSTENQLAPILAVASTKALWLYSVVSRHYRLRGDRDAELVALDRGVELAVHRGLPLVTGLCTIEAAFSAWIYADDVRFGQLVDTLRQSKRHGSEKGVSFFLACADGDVNARPAFEVYVHRAYAYLVLAERVLRAEGSAEALAVVRRGIAAADLSGQLFVRILSRVLLAALSPETRNDAQRAVAHLIGDLCDGSLRRACEGWLTDGAMSQFDAFSIVRRFVASDTGRVCVWLSVGMVTQGSHEVPLSPRERELVCYLAAVRRPATQEEILDVVFSDDSPASRNQLKVYISRIRKRLGANALATYDFGYGLGTDVATDVSDIDKMLAVGPTRISGKLLALSNNIERLGRGHVMNWPWYVRFERAILAKVAKLNRSLEASYRVLGDESAAIAHGGRADFAESEMAGA
jgi:hypothetical protein